MTTEVEHCGYGYRLKAACLFENAVSVVTVIFDLSLLTATRSPSTPAVSREMCPAQ